MEKWLESIYSDSSKNYVSNPLPKNGDEITVSIRMYEDAPVQNVFLRRTINGVENLAKMYKYKTENGLSYYSCKMNINEPYIHYQFYITTSNKIYYYTQREITTYIPDHTYDFRIVSDYRQPEWVKGCVFYQIYPDRFYNGNPDNDVKTGEYSYCGHETIHIENWNTPAADYTKTFCLDFYGGDLEGIEKKIPYLKKLGVNAVYVNPIFYSACVHRYDCLDYFKVDKHVGGDEGFAELCDALHRNGMKIILDVSINHTGIGAKWFNRDGEFFDKSVGAYNNPDSEERQYYFFKEGTNEYKCWYDIDTLPTLNYTSEKLKDILYKKEDSLIKKWLKPPYSIDGWRFDVADVMCRMDEVQLQHTIWPEINNAIKDTNPEAYILAEDWGDCGEFINGHEWDSPMNYFGCGRPVRQFVGDDDLFNERCSELKLGYKMTAKDLAMRIKEHFDKIPTALSQIQFNLLDSHDTCRLHNKDIIKFCDYVNAVIMLFTLPGATSIYYGDEAGIDGRPGDNEGSRFPMPWDSGFEEKDFYKLYSTLAQYKNNNEVLSDGGFKIVWDNDYVFSYARFTEDRVMFAICSCDDEVRTIQIPIKAFGKNSLDGIKMILSDKPDYNVDSEGNVVITVQPHSGYVFEI